MKHYEQILSKIAPTFFKLEQYVDYFDNIDYPIITLYLSKAKLPQIYDVYLPLNWSDRKFYSMQAIKNTNYYYHIGVFAFEIKGKKLYMKEVTMNKKYKLNKWNIWRVSVSLSEFIGNMIINNFSLENEYIHYPYKLTTYAKSYKDLFIAMVGKDMYETLRANIR